MYLYICFYLFNNEVGNNPLALTGATDTWFCNRDCIRDLVAIIQNRITVLGALTGRIGVWILVPLVLWGKSQHAAEYSWGIH